MFSELTEKKSVLCWVILPDLEPSDYNLSIKIVVDIIAAVHHFLVIQDVDFGNNLLKA